MSAWERADPAVREILEKYRSVWGLDHSLATLAWDTETGMPEAGATGRGIASGQLAMMFQRAVLALKGPVSRAEKSKSLDDRDEGVVRILKRSLDYYTKIPPELVDKLQRTTTEATVVWRKARKNSDFKLFAPHLEKILELKQQEADKLGYKKHRYNALLDLYDEGMTVSDADAIFSRLVPGVKKIMEKVQSEGVFPKKHPLEALRYEVPAMMRLNEETLRTLKMPSERFKMAISTHPFCQTISPDDVRITTRYEGSDFKASLFAVMHECGHAMYELGVAKDLRYTPIYGGASLGIHESQSRFWENAVGRSKGYAKLAYPTIRKNLPFVSKYSADELYLYFNSLRSSMIRVEADELTYNLHIALRYDVEKKMLEGKVAVSELPELWNDLFEEYLGTRPKKDSDGVLQDVHWGGGSIGYFPTYTLGNVVLGMIWHKMDDGRMIADSIKRGDLISLRRWLGTNIHRWGQTYSPKQLLTRTFGETYNPEWLLSYLSDKYLEA